MAKAKLAPLLQKGETVRNELCGATYSARLKDWICVNSDTTFGKHYHIIDSSIVQAMIRRTSYGFNTFAGLRIGEIQQKTDESNWFHVESCQNIADILTRGAPPNVLKAGSAWQNGPAWLSKDFSDWPVKLSCNFQDPAIIQSAKSKVNKVSQFKPLARSIVDVFSGMEILDVLLDVDGLCARISSLDKVLRVAAYVLRLTFNGGQPSQSGLGLSKKLGAVNISDLVPPISASERDDAWKVMVALDQLKLDEKNLKRLVPAVVPISLTNYQFKVSHLILGGRVKQFPQSFTLKDNIPIISNGPFGKLIVQKFHYIQHK